jgi:hypothetical protein
MISPTHTVSAEWQNENALRAYPLVDDCKAADVLPAWLLTDLRVTIDSTYEKVYVSSAYVSDTLVSVAVSGVRSGREVGLLAKTLTRDELEPYAAYSMDVLGSASGLVAFGEIPDFASFGLSFGPDDAPLVESAVTHVRAPGVTKIVDAAFGAEATGIVDLSGNSEFRTYLDSDGYVVVELVDMYRDLTTSVCNSTPSYSACGRTPVKTISGVAPDASGKITLRFR